MTIREYSTASMMSTINTASLHKKLDRMPELSVCDKAGLIVGEPMHNARLLTVKGGPEWDYHFYIVDRGVKHHILNLDVDDNLMMMSPMNVKMDTLLKYKNGEQMRHADYDESEDAMELATDE